jgi:hypothetical protein
MQGLDRSESGSIRYYRSITPYTLGSLVCSIIPVLCAAGWLRNAVPGWFAFLFGGTSIVAAVYCVWILSQKRPVIEIDMTSDIIRLESVVNPMQRWVIPFDAICSTALEYEAGTTLRLLSIVLRNPKTAEESVLQSNLQNIEVDPRVVYERVNAVRVIR